jgi:hypothetical protein
MSDNKRRVLEMLADNKISVDEATRLLSLVEPPATPTDGPSVRTRARNGDAKYLRVQVQPRGDSNGEVEHVNIRVPMGLIRSGIKLTALIPGKAADQVNDALRDKGIDMDIRDFKTEDLETLVDALNELEVDVESGKEKVRIYVE